MRNLGLAGYAIGEERTSPRLVEAIAAIVSQAGIQPRRLKKCKCKCKCQRGRGGVCGASFRFPKHAGLLFLRLGQSWESWESSSRRGRLLLAGLSLVFQSVSHYHTPYETNGAHGPPMYTRSVFNECVAESQHLFLRM